MARKIGLLTHAYKAVHVVRYRSGGEETIVEGIYNKPGTAQGRLTFWKNHLGEDYVDGWIEEAALNWYRVS